MYSSRPLDIGMENSPSSTTSAWTDAECGRSLRKAQPANERLRVDICRVGRGGGAECESPLGGAAFHRLLWVSHAYQTRDIPETVA